MRKIKIIFLLLGLTLLKNVVLGVFGSSNVDKEYLPSWNDITAKKQLMEYVKRVTDIRNEGYIKPEDRIAVLDLEGTLMVEEPVNFECAIATQRLKEIASSKTDLRDIQPYKSAWEDEESYHNDRKNHNIAFLKAFENFSHEDYVNYIEDFLKSHKAPYWGVPFEELFYKPSLELVDFLKKNGFEIFISSASEEACIRLLLRNVLNMKSHEIIGNEVNKVCAEKKGECIFIMTEEFVKPENKQEGKCLSILKHIGKRPVLAFGNCMDDYEMLKYTKQATKENFVMILDHDDPRRELEYHCDALIDYAKQNGWVIVSMKNDFKKIF